jgi:hypothetical protein
LKRAAYLGHDAAPLFEFLSSLPQILALVFKALKPGEADADRDHSDIEHRGFAPFKSIEHARPDFCGIKNQ